MTDFDRGFISGSWDAFNQVLNHLQTVETKLIDKRDLFQAIMDMRPRNVPSVQPED